MSDRSRVRLAIAALRGGRPVRIDGPAPIGILAVETATAEMLELAGAEARAPFLISAQRAAALSLTNAREAADPNSPVLIAREPWLDVPTALALADAGADFNRALAAPLHPLPIGEAATAEAAIALAKLSGLLPAVWLISPEKIAVAISADEISNAARSPDVQIVARAKLPLDDMPATQIIAFRASDDGQEHVALVVGAFAGKTPLVRLHSECLTGDVFGSLKCDCGPQLKEALRIFGDEGGGVLLYLRQEGRGIGLANKLRAYALQDRGLDTVEANVRLGFEDDERDYGHAAAMLRTLGIDAVRLLTNNPRKVAGLQAAGISVIERVPHHMPVNPHNADYLATKRRKSGHLA